MLSPLAPAPLWTWLVSYTRKCVPAALLVTNELPVAFVRMAMAFVSVYLGLVLIAELAASLGGRNTWLKAAPVMADSTLVKSVSVGWPHVVRVLVAGTIEFTVSAGDKRFAP